MAELLRPMALPIAPPLQPEEDAGDMSSGLKRAAV
jgi:hypothetical protein